MNGSGATFISQREWGVGAPLPKGPRGHGLAFLSLLSLPLLWDIHCPEGRRPDGIYKLIIRTKEYNNNNK